MTTWMLLPMLLLLFLLFTPRLSWDLCFYHFISSIVMLVVVGAVLALVLVTAAVIVIVVECFQKGPITSNII